MHAYIHTYTYPVCEHFSLPCVQVGDRVLVGGAKTGLLKYVGKTDFAKGIWAGIELDEAIGKNDGAVAGKRYAITNICAL